MGGPVATHMKCCPAHLNSCPTSTRTMKNPLPWQKKVMCKIRPRNQGAVLAQGGSWTRGGGGTAWTRGVPSATLSHPRGRTKGCVIMFGTFNACRGGGGHSEGLWLQLRLLECWMHRGSCDTEQSDGAK